MNNPQTGAENAPGLDEKDFSALLDGISTMAPLMRGMFGGGEPDKGEQNASGSGKKGCGRREALLIAIKPYLAEDRQEAVDYLIRIGRLGDMVRRFTTP